MGLVASGVTSRGVNPVPPVVRTSRFCPGEVDDRRCDRVRVILHDAPLDLEPLRGQELRQRVATQILPRAVMNAVRDGEHGGLHTGSLVFSTSVTPEIVIALSIALAMS